MVAMPFKKPKKNLHSSKLGSSILPPLSALSRDLHSHHQPPTASAQKGRAVRFDQDQFKNESKSGANIMRKGRGVREVKVLLLGQSESGKSTLQTNLQIHLSPTTFNTSRSAYKPAIYLNIITALRALFIELDYQLSFPQLHSTSRIVDDNSKFIVSVRELREELQLDQIRLRLLPLMALESLLVTELTEGITFTSGARTRPFVRPGWQTRINPSWHLISSSASSKQSSSWNLKRTSSSSSDLAFLCSKTIASSVPDIYALWNHWITKFYVSKRVVPLDDTAPYFLDHIERIGEPGYRPTNDDILHARIQSLGVTEEEYTMPSSIPQSPAWKWKVYDVSGVRGQRGVWIPFFDDASVVIFLAPISAFDQYLPENPTINRLTDSLHLWAAICSNKLLQDARLVLFLNKIDLLKKKLDDGVCVRKYISSFSDRPNDFLTAASYFRAHFEHVQQKRDVVRPKRRRLFVHFTSMLDTKAMVTQCVVSQVKEVISKKNTAELTTV